jgi:protein kinase-like protein/nuclease-like protein
MAAKRGALADIIDNQRGAPRETRGFRFEEEVRETLRKGLPPTYVVVQAAILHADERTSARSQPRPADVDFVVVGPNGLFLLEAKYANRVEGKMYGNWMFGVPHAAGTAQSSLDSPGYKMKVNLTAASERIRRYFRQELDPYQNARGLFVFPPGAQLAITSDVDGRPHETFERGMLRLVRLPQLCEEIFKTPAPVTDKGGPPARSLHPDGVKAIAARFDVGTRPPPGLVDYEVLGEATFRRAPNGLSYGVFSLRHRFTGRPWRGRCYDLSALGERDRDRFEEEIRRHPRVLSALGDHPNVLPIHDFITDRPGHCYWVIEYPVDGELLSRLLDGGKTLPVRTIAGGIAAGLRAIHQEGYVCRDLNPEAIWIQRDTAKPLLTNFELAKALDGAPTVAGSAVDLGEGDYRAPEVRRGGLVIDARADVYSWGAIVFHVVIGQAYQSADMLSQLDRQDLPSKITELIRQCLAPRPSDRPSGMDVVHGTLRGWRDR